MILCWFLIFLLCSRWVESVELFCWAPPELADSSRPAQLRRCSTYVHQQLNKQTRIKINGCDQQAGQDSWSTTPVPVDDSSIGSSVDPWSACAGATGAAGGWCWRERRSVSSKSSRMIGVDGPWRTDQFIWAARRFHFLIAAMPHCDGCWRPQRILQTLWWTRA